MKKIVIEYLHIFSDVTDVSLTHNRGTQWLIALNITLLITFICNFACIFHSMMYVDSGKILVIMSSTIFPSQGWGEFPHVILYFIIIIYIRFSVNLIFL